ncbi:MAG: TetR/AcrR family transcriptional regulator [Ruminococcus sp.]|nr:TetR/AcrR family transcriptional regulator [Ruminococcus sp.]
MEYKKILENAKNDRMTAAVQYTAELLLKRDVSEITMTDIAEGCEIGVASLYRWFGTKPVLVMRAGCLLWQSVRALFDGVFECDYYKQKNGIGQLGELMKVFKVLYLSHQDFLRFLDSFDRYILSEDIPPEELEQYRRSVMDFYPLLESAYQNGIRDGSARAGLDFRILYLAVTHALMQMSEKFARGDIFEGENEFAERELDLMIDMAMRYVAAKEELQ